MIKAYKYRLYPSLKQRKHFAKAFGCVRYIYNQALEAKTKHYQETGKNLSYFDLTTNWLQTQKKDNDWLEEPYSQSLQMALRNLDNAYTNFFKKRGKFPKFKSRHYTNSCAYTQGVKIDWKNSLAWIPKCGKVSVVLHRSFEGKIKTCTVSKTPTGKYYLSVLVDNGTELPKKPKIHPKKSVGIDLGIKDYAVLSTGHKIANPKFLEASLRRLKQQQRRLSKKTKGSNNYSKQRQKVARAHEKVSFQRKDFLHKLSSQIVRENQTIILEDLGIKDLMERAQNHSMARHIGDAAWGTFVDYLTYKCEWYGKNLLKIGRFDPSTKTCSKCGFIHPHLSLSDREWNCPQCHSHHDRDINAALNIKNFGLIAIGLGQPGKPAENRPRLVR